MIHIREARTDDREQLVQLVYRQDNFNEMEFAVALEVIDDMLTGKSDYRILVAADKENSIAGYICFGQIPLTEHRYDLYWIAVDPASRRMGIGAQLLYAMEEELRGKGGGHVYIDTSSTSGYRAAHGLYDVNGYEVTCVLNDFYRNGDDKIIYKKEL